VETPEENLSANYLADLAEGLVLKMSQDAKECYAAILQGFGKTKSMADLAKALGLKNRQNAATRRDQMQAEMESLISGLDISRDELLQVLKLVSHILYPIADLEGFQI